MTGPDTPPGWSYNPSAWTQRLPIIFLALIGLLVARYLTAYQLGQISGVWEPFFPGLPDEPGKNGAEAVITSSVSEARSEEHTSELQSLMRISYAVFCLKKKKKKSNIKNT